MTQVTLSWFELFIAAQRGAMRQIEALKERRRDNHGFSGDGWGVHIEGACGEMAWARVSDRYWNPVVKNPYALPGDVGDVQIRASKKDSAHLLLHESDPDDALFVLVTGEAPHFRIVGEILGREGKRQEWFGDPYGTNRPCFWVPQSALRGSR